MKKLLCVVLVVAACAKEGARTPPAPAAKYAGTWEGRSFRSATDSGVAWTTTMNVGADGSLSGTLTFTGSKLSPVAVRMLQLTDSTVGLDVGPYISPTAANTEVLTRIEEHVAGDSLWGTFVMLPTQGGLVTPGMSAAKWSNFEMHPAKGAEPIRGTLVAKRKRAS